MELPAGPRTIAEDDFESEADDYEWPKCCTCKGAGTVNPLTAPFFCVGTMTCPDCDGTGEDN